MEEDIPRNYTIAQKRALFFRFVEFNDPHFNDELKAKVRSTSIHFIVLYGEIFVGKFEVLLSHCFGGDESILFFFVGCKKRNR